MDHRKRHAYYFFFEGQKNNFIITMNSFFACRCEVIYPGLLEFWAVSTVMADILINKY